MMTLYSFLFQTHHGKFTVDMWTKNTKTTSSVGRQQITNLGVRVQILFKFLLYLRGSAIDKWRRLLRIWSSI